MFLGLHGGSGSTEEAWGTSDVKYIPYVHELLAYHMYKDIKGALKLQTDGEEEGKFCISNFPLLRKVGIWLDLARAQCHTTFLPGEGLALDEMMILATMPNPYSAWMPLKPSVRRGTKLIALCWS